MQLFYFAVGFAIAAVLVLLLGCTPSTNSAVYEEREIILLPEPEPEPKMCCMALTPSCEACQEGLDVEDWLIKTCGKGATDAEYAGWDKDAKKPIWLCQSVIID